MTDEVLRTMIEGIKEKVDATHKDVSEIKGHFTVPDGCVPAMMQRVQQLEDRHKVTRAMITGIWVVLVAVIGAIGGLFWNHIASEQALTVVKSWLRI